jgi:hypothetical protein
LLPFADHSDEDQPGPSDNGENGENNGESNVEQGLAHELEAGQLPEDAVAMPNPAVAVPAVGK